MNCEICGKKILTKPIQISIERSILTVCQECSRYGTGVDKKTAFNIQQKLIKPPSKIKPKIVKKAKFDEFVLVDNFGELIRRGRVSLGISREEFAKKLGEKESVIRRIEAGEMYPPADLISKIERLLKITLRAKIDESFKGDLPSPSSLTLGDVAILKEGKND
ncbi:MAG: multiprotein bridging factor aMBF1 [Candidatus Methanomethylicaceae archaeon]